MSETAPRELTTVATFWDPYPAQVARLRLAHEGIRAFLDKEFTVQMAWHLTNAIGGIRLLVPQERLEEARRLLATRVPFNDWFETRCWEPRLNGQPIGREEPNAAAGEDRYQDPSPREELAERALRASILATSWFTTFPFACCYVYSFYSTAGRCRPAYQRKAKVAFWLMAVVVGPFLLIPLALFFVPDFVSYLLAGLAERSGVYQHPFRY